MIFISKQTCQRSQSHKKGRWAYLDCNPKRFYANIKVSLTNMAYDIHFLSFKKSSNDQSNTNQYQA